MLDREKKDKERQEVLETTLRSYRTAMENAFALQERSLEFAQSLLEGPATALRAQATNNRATLQTLNEQTRRQREALENLIQESTSIYVDLLQMPFSYYQDVVQAMTTPWAVPGDSQRKEEVEVAEPAPEASTQSIPEGVTEAAAEAQAAAEAAAEAVAEAAAEAEEAAAEAEEAAAETEDRTGGDLPIADYDSLNVREVSSRLDDLSAEEIEQLRDYEAENKNRRTLIERLDAKLQAGSAS